MANIIIIDGAGGIVIPEEIRRLLGLQPGDALELTATAGEIALRPVREKDALVKEQGIWVCRTGDKVSNDDISDVVDRIRDVRLEHVLG